MRPDRCRPATRAVPPGAPVVRRPRGGEAEPRPSRRSTATRPSPTRGLVRVGWQRHQSVDDLIGLLNTYSYVIRASDETRATLAAARSGRSRIGTVRGRPGRVDPGDLSGLAVDMPMTSTEHTVLTRSQWRAAASRRMPNGCDQLTAGPSGAGQRSDTAPGRGFPVHLLLAATGDSSGAGTRGPGSPWPTPPSGSTGASTGCWTRPPPSAPSTVGPTVAVDIDGVPVGPRCADRRSPPRLLDATSAAPAQFGCFGLHEWAMVYRQDDRSAAALRIVPLRLGQAGTDEVVRDASDPLHPLRRVPVLHPAAPGRATLLQPDLDVAGRTWSSPAACMRRWTSTSGPTSCIPVVPSDLLLDCFVLARAIRELDMRASPYDLTDLGYPPVRIETAAGQGGIRRRSTGLRGAAQVLRRRLSWTSSTGIST